MTRLINREFELGYVTDATLHMVWRFRHGGMDFRIFPHDEEEELIINHLEQIGVPITKPGTIPHPITWVKTQGAYFRRYCFTQNGDGDSLDMFWVLLDNQSTVDVFCNKDLLTDTCRINKSITI